MAIDDDRRLASDIVAAVGGAENVKAVTHCVTRLRFTLKDESAADDKTVSGIKGVMGTTLQGGQYQVVIGNRVPDIYRQVTPLVGSGAAKGDRAPEAAPQGNLFKRGFNSFTRMISAIFTPLLSVLVAAGFLKALLGMAEAFGWASADTSGTYVVLDAIGDALFYSFPVFLGFTAAKHFKLNPMIGGAIGAAMIYPTIVSAASEGTVLSFFGIPVNVADYTSTVFPVIIVVWAASYLERVLQKIVPSALKLLFVPLVTLVISVPFGLILIGPIVNWASGLLSDASFAIYNFSPALAGVVLGGPWLLIVMFGLHWAFIPVFINNLVSTGTEPTLGLLMANQMAVAGAAIAVAIRSKSILRRELGYSTGFSALLGVSEPAIYGLLLPLKKPFIAAIIGGSAGGLVAALFGTTYYAFGWTGIFALPSVINPAGMDEGFWGGLFSMTIGFVVGLVLTLVLLKKGEGEAEEVEAAGVSIAAPVAGTVVPLAEVKDKTFAEGMLGSGVGIIPTEGVVTSPVEGEIVSAMPHAYGIRTPGGLEILVHIGIDTVKLEGAHFAQLVEIGDSVNRGQKLAEVDLDAVRVAGYDTTTLVVVTNVPGGANVTVSSQGEVKGEDELLGVAS